MTTTLEQAARQALECLEDVFGKGKVDVGAINALREALAEQADMNLNCKSVQARLAASWGYVKAEQAEQEPVAWRECVFCGIEHQVKSDGYILDTKTDEVFCRKCYVHTHENPVKQEPVAAYKDAPRVIYLQTGCEDPEFCECSFNEWGDTTWCAEKIHDTDIPYIRADYAAPVRTKDLTDDEIAKDCGWEFGQPLYEWVIGLARAVIAADREKNK